MACGDRYLFLATTESGYTPSNPHGLFYLPGDYAEWLHVAQRAVGILSKHMAVLQATELEEDQPSLPKFTELTGEWTAALQAYDELPSVWNGAGMHVTEAIDATMRALCVLEQVDDAIQGYSRKPPELPSPGRRPAPGPPTPHAAGFGGGELLWIGIFGAIGYGVYWLTKDGD